MKPKLTMREQEVLVELAKGPANHAEVAERLGISRIALRGRLQDMRAKTGTESTVQLLLWGLRAAVPIATMFPEEPTP